MKDTFLRSVTRIGFAILLCAVFVNSNQAQVDQRRLALVIGNDEYEGMARLNNGVADAGLVSSTLTEVGVDSVVLYTNVDRREMEAAFSEFFRDMLRFDIGIIYYAGHGMQDEFGDGFLIPVDFPANQGQSALFDFAYPLDRVLRRMRNVDSKSFVAFLDACRNNPYSSGSRSGGTGLGAPILPAEGVIVGYSTMAGSIAGDYSESANGLYATSLASALKVPNVPVESLLKNVGASTRTKSMGEQNPEWWGNLSGDVFIHSDPRKYEVELMQVQDAIVDEIAAVWSWPEAGSFWYRWSAMGVEVPDWLFASKAQLRFIGENHLEKGLDDEFAEAELFRLWLSLVESLVHKGGVQFADSLTSEALDFDFEILPAYKTQERFCAVFGIQSELEYQLFVTYMLLTVDSFNALRIERMIRFRDLLVEIDNPVLSVIGHHWLRVLGAKHGGYEEFNTEYSRPKLYPFVLHNGVVESVYTGSVAWDQGLRPGCSFQEFLNEDNGVQSWMVVDNADSSKFKVDFVEGSYYIQRDGKGMEMLSDADLVTDFTKHSEELCEAESEEMKWIIGVSERCPDYMRILPGQGIYVAAFNMSEMAIRTSSQVVSGRQNPSWDARLALLANSLEIANRVNNSGVYGSGVSEVFYRRLGFDMNSLNVRLTSMSDSAKASVNWRKVRKVLLSATEVYSSWLDDWSGYSGLLDPLYSHYPAYSIGGRLFDFAASMYSLRDECAFTEAEINSVEALLSNMEDDWYVTGGEVDQFFLNYAGSKCWNLSSSDPNRAAEVAALTLSTLVDSLYHSKDFEVSLLYDTSPFISFLSNSSWEGVSDLRKLDVIEGVIKMNAKLSCGYVRPVYWGLDIAETIDVGSLNFSSRKKLERYLLLLVDSSLLCFNINDENKRGILSQLDVIVGSYSGPGWFEYENGLESCFEYRFGE